MKRTVAPAPHLHRTGFLVVVASVVAIGFATLLPEPGAAVGSHWCLLCGSLGGVNLVLNVLLFVPLGVGLALWGSRGPRAIVAMCALSVLIETAQLFVIPGRYSTVGDVLTNSLGGALGYVIGRYAYDFLRPQKRIALALGGCWSALWLTIQATSAFAFSPLIPRSEYYGQIAPCLGGFEQFDGRVLRATIADRSVPDARLEDSEGVRQLLMSKAALTLTILPPRSRHAIAPIVRIADTSQREVLLLAQAGSDLVFGERTGAAALRLRPPLFVLADALSAANAGSGEVAKDTIAVSARYSAGEVWIKARSATSYDHRIPITASLAWTVLLPFQWFIRGTGIELALSALWTAFLMLPIGYWGASFIQFLRSRRAPRTQVIGLLIALAVLYGGLVAVPHWFGLAAASPLDWLAALTGVLAGSALATRTSERDSSRPR